MISSLTERYERSRNRLFLLDYDGTLVGLKSIPKLAVPTARILHTLRGLCRDPRNLVVIVSGRDRQFLDQCMGDLPVAFAAEHGFFIKDRAEKTWHATSAQPAHWKQLVRRLMRTASQGRPGTRIEEKVSALVWHYRQAGPNASHAAADLRRALTPQLQKLGLRAVPGSKIVEVRPTNVGKGKAAGYWLAKSDYDFILAAGDDTTDEDLFKAMPDHAISFKVGPGKTHADRRLLSPQALASLLESFVHLGDNSNA